jgi:hypothetical protein
LTPEGVWLPHLTDLVLLGKIYHLCGMVKEAREVVISLGKMR